MFINRIPEQCRGPIRLLIPIFSCVKQILVIVTNDVWKSYWIIYECIILSQVRSLLCSHSGQKSVKLCFVCLNNDAECLEGVVQNLSFFTCHRISNVLYIFCNSIGWSMALISIFDMQRSIHFINLNNQLTRCTTIESQCTSLSKMQYCFKTNIYWMLQIIFLIILNQGKCFMHIYFHWQEHNVHPQIVRQRT